MSDTNAWAEPPTGRIRQLGNKLRSTWRGPSKNPPPLQAPLFAKDDWLLWQQACAGHNPSAIVLVRQLTPQALRIAMQLLRHTEDAQDAVQESFLRLWNSQAQDTRVAQLATYFNTIVINRCKTHLIRKRELGVEPNSWVELFDAQQSQLDTVDQPPFSPTELQAALACLPARQRMALAMWAYADAQVPEIAKALDLEINATHQLLFRAKQSFRTALQGAKS